MLYITKQKHFLKYISHIQVLRKPVQPWAEICNYISLLYCTYKCTTIQGGVRRQGFLYSNYRVLYYHMRISAAYYRSPLNCIDLPRVTAITQCEICHVIGVSITILHIGEISCFMCYSIVSIRRVIWGFISPQLSYHTFSYRCTRKNNTMKIAPRGINLKPLLTAARSDGRWLGIA